MERRARISGKKTDANSLISQKTRKVNGSWDPKPRPKTQKLQKDTDAHLRKDFGARETIGNEKVE